MSKNQLPMLNSGETPWYKEGLSFSCSECGKCCTGAPGYIWLNDSEIRSIAKSLNMDLDEFARKYLRKINSRWSLKEDPKTYDCVFLKDKKCTIYSERPTQCRTYPWWPENLESKERWEEEAEWCEGIDSSAPTVSIETIEQQMSIQRNECPKKK